jgi:hypothetical protein
MAAGCSFGYLFELFEEELLLMISSAGFQLSYIIRLIGTGALF